MGDNDKIVKHIDRLKRKSSSPEPMGQFQPKLAQRFPIGKGDSSFYQ